eukprot:342956-Chlamydomonas_euryale.AAC.2
MGGRPSNIQTAGLAPQQSAHALMRAMLRCRVCVYVSVRMVLEPGSDAMPSAGHRPNFISALCPDTIMC